MDAATPLPTDALPADDEEARRINLRASPRDSMLLLAVVQRRAHPEVQVRVRNLSSGGLMAETPASFLRDEVIQLELRGIGPVTGKVAWTATGKVGIAFDHPVDPKLARKPVAAVPDQASVREALRMWRPERE